MDFPFRRIRHRLGLTQAAVAKGLGVTQGNVSLYEKGQTVPPAVAARLIFVAAEHGILLTFDHVYGAAELIATEGAPPVPQPADQQEAA